MKNFRIDVQEGKATLFYFNSNMGQIIHHDVMNQHIFLAKSSRIDTLIDLKDISSALQTKCEKLLLKNKELFMDFLTYVRNK